MNFSCQQSWASSFFACAFIDNILLLVFQRPRIVWSWCMSGNHSGQALLSFKQAWTRRWNVKTSRRSSVLCGPMPKSAAMLFFLFGLQCSPVERQSQAELPASDLFGLTLPSNEMGMDQDSSKPSKTHINSPFWGWMSSHVRPAILVFTRVLEFKLYQSSPAHISSWHLNFIHQRLNWLAPSQVGGMHLFSAQRTFCFVCQSSADAGQAEDMLTWP